MFSPRILAAAFVLLVVVGLAWVGREPPRVNGAGLNPAAALANGPQVVAGSGNPRPEVVDEVRAMVEGRYAALLGLIPVAEPRRFFVFVHASRAELPTAIAAHLHEDSPAFALLGQHQVHLVWGEMFRLGSSPPAVVTHELVHELLDQFVAPHGAALPRWFHEGLAQFLAGDTYLGAREEDLVWRVVANRLLPFSELVRGFPDDRESVRLAYAQSYSFVTWLVRELGLPGLLRAAANTDDLVPFEGALFGVSRRPTLDLRESWQRYLLGSSGAPWRVLLAEWWGLLGVALLPVLALALRRRLAAGARAAAAMSRAEEEQRQAEELYAEHLAAQQLLTDAPAEDEPFDPDHEGSFGPHATPRIDEEDRTGRRDW